MQKLLPDVNLKWDKETDKVTADWSEARAYIQACSTKCSLFQYKYYRDSRYRNYARRRTSCNVTRFR